MLVFVNYAYKQNMQKFNMLLLFTSNLVKNILIIMQQTCKWQTHLPIYF